MIILKLYGSMPIYAHSYTIYTYILEIICKRFNAYSWFLFFIYNYFEALTILSQEL